MHKCSNLSTTSSTLVIFSFFDSIYPKGVEVESHRGFALYSPNISYVEYVFTCFLAICISPVAKYLFKSFADNTEFKLIAIII